MTGGDTAAGRFAMTVCGIGELGSHDPASHVLSILDPDHPVPEAFTTFGSHAKLELRFHDIIGETPGQVLPQPSHVAAILAFGRTLQAAAASHLLVHCHAGISRSTAALTLLLAQARPELTADAVLAQVHALREKAWPNLRMMEIGDTLLGRGGALVVATHGLHRLQIGRRPHIVELMEKAGRGREIGAALALPQP